MATMIPDARQLVLGCLLAACWCLPPSGADANTLSAYSYTHTGVDGLPSLSSNIPAGVSDVFLKAIDIASDGTVFPKLWSGHFYPYASGGP